jgi:hypothetical protein
MSLRRLYLNERGSGTVGVVGSADTLAQEPWRPSGPGGWTKAHGQMTATVSMSPRGDGSYVVTSTMGAGIKQRRQQVPCRNEAEALAKAEVMKREIDGRAL